MAQDCRGLEQLNHDADCLIEEARQAYISLRADKLTRLIPRWEQLRGEIERESQRVSSQVKDLALFCLENDKTDVIVREGRYDSSAVTQLLYTQCRLLKQTVDELRDQNTQLKGQQERQEAGMTELARQISDLRKRRPEELPELRSPASLPDQDVVGMGEAPARDTVDADLSPEQIMAALDNLHEERDSEQQQSSIL